jgi:Family of unknown function (DUF6526)
MTQNYANHVHRPVAVGVGYLLVLTALTSFVLRWFGIGGRLTFGIGLMAVLGALVTLLLVSRWYIVRLQDRIIKLEMRVRAAQLLTADQQRALFLLTNKQIAALRFASDDELPALLERTTREQLASRDIKKSVKNWRPDLDRT